MSEDHERVAVMIAAVLRDTFGAEALQVAERQAAEAHDDTAAIWQRILRILRLSHPE